MTLTTIEKAAKLMGLTIIKVHSEGLLVERGVFHMPFNPYTSKSDLMDVECALGIDVEWNEATEYVFAAKRNAHREYLAAKFEYSKNHPNKFTARAHAVMAVVEQIYDRQFGE